MVKISLEILFRPLVLFPTAPSVTLKGLNVLFYDAWLNGIGIISGKYSFASEIIQNISLLLLLSFSFQDLIFINIFQDTKKWKIFAELEKTAHVACRHNFRMCTNKLNSCCFKWIIYVLEAAPLLCICDVFLSKHSYGIKSYFKDCKDSPPPCFTSWEMALAMASHFLFFSLSQ